MTADEIKALIERLRHQKPTGRLPNADEDDAADALESLLSQLTAKTELATLYAASLRQSEREVEGLKVENQRLLLEFRADCEKHAEELFAVQRDAERYRWLRDFDLRCKDGVNINPPCEHVHASMYAHAVGTIPAVRLVTGDELDRAIDAARSQSDKEKP